MELNKADCSVFLENKPPLNTLKACTFFWENICVYEYFIQTLPDRPDLYDISRLLLEKGILKIAVDDMADFKYGLSDKIYYGFDKEFLDYLYQNANKITIVPKLPTNIDELIKEASDIEDKDIRLHALIDFYIHKGIEDEALEALYQNSRFPFNEAPKNFQDKLLKKIKDLADSNYYSVHGQFPPEERYNFRGRNKGLLYKFSVSSVILSSIYQLPYYNYKFTDFRSHDATRYIKTLNETMPFVKRKTIDDFSFDDILDIRKNSRWKKAMHQLGEICNRVKFESDTKEFEDEIKNEIVLEYQNALGEAEVSSDDLLKDVAKGSVLTGISLIPVIGNVISAVGSFIDPVVSYFQNVKKQKSLPFFLNDIRKM